MAEGIAHPASGTPGMDNRVNLAGVRHLLTLFTLLRQHKVELPDELGSIDVSLPEPTG
jgi:hypothetical protein